MDTGLSEKAEIFLNGLLEPAADQRLGVRGVGPEEIRAKQRGKKKKARKGPKKTPVE